MAKFYTVEEFEALVRERVKPMPALIKKVAPKHTWTQAERDEASRWRKKMYHEWRAAKARFDLLST